MSGLLRPVGPEAAQTYWARRGLVFGATMVLALAVLLIITGATIGSAAHSNPSPSIAGYAMPSSASPTSMPTAIPTPSAVDPSASTASAGPESTAPTRAASTRTTRKERDGGLRSRRAQANPDWQTAPRTQAAHHVSALLDQRIRPDVHRAGDTEEL